jgi:DNA-directed RNA polymerase specialized sigma24 family protein
MLGSPERALVAVENTRLAASCNPRKFEYEGEFRSWLLRVLIDEALAILRKDQEEIANGDFGFRSDSFGTLNQLHENESYC